MAPSTSTTKTSSTTMTKRKYPRATVRKIVKGHAQKKLSRDIDALIYLNWIQFIDKLLLNALTKAKQSGEKNVAAKDIRKVTLTTLRQFRG